MDLPPPQTSNCGILTTDSPIHDCWQQIGVWGNGTCGELVKHVHCRNCAVYGAAGRQWLDRELPAEYRRERATEYAQAAPLVRAARVTVLLFRLAEEWLALPTTVFQEVAEGRQVHSLPHRRVAGSNDARGMSRDERDVSPSRATHHPLPPLVLGLVNVRGELLICASLARLLGLEEERDACLPRGAPARPVHEREVATDAIPRSRGTRDSSPKFRRLLVARWPAETRAASAADGPPLQVAFPVAEVAGLHWLPQTDLQLPPATLTRPAPAYTQATFRWRDHTVGLLDAEVLFQNLLRRLG